MPRRSVDDYRHVIGEAEVASIRELARALEGARVLHLSATSFGTHLAGTLSVLVALMRDVGMDVHWAVPRAVAGYRGAANAIYEALAGGHISWTAELLELWESYGHHNAGLIAPDYDFVIVHDPQPVPILASLMERGEPVGKWIWHCHLDLRDAQPEAWDLVQRQLGNYSALVLEQPTFAGDRLPERPRAVMPPAIDPLGPRNIDLPAEDQERILGLYGIDPRRPLLTQVSRLDRWSDPLAVIDVYRRVKPTFPELQLVLLAVMSDDTAGRLQFEQMARRAGDEPDIHLFSSLNLVADLATNIFQRASTLNFLRSVRKGFSPILLEASWKGRPVVAGMAGELPGQIVEGDTGFLAATVERLASRVVELLLNPERVEEMGRAGHRLVRERFLITRYLTDYLNLLAGMVATSREAVPDAKSPGGA